MNIVKRQSVGYGLVIPRLLKKKIIYGMASSLPQYLRVERYD